LDCSYVNSSHVWDSGACEGGGPPVSACRGAPASTSRDCNPSPRQVVRVARGAAIRGRVRKGGELVLTCRGAPATTSMPSPCAWCLSSEETSQRNLYMDIYHLCLHDQVPKPKLGIFCFEDMSFRAPPRRTHFSLYKTNWYLHMELIYTINSLQEFSRLGDPRPQQKGDGKKRRTPPDARKSASAPQCGALTHLSPCLVGACCLDCLLYTCVVGLCPQMRSSIICSEGSWALERKTNCWKDIPVTILTDSAWTGALSTRRQERGTPFIGECRRGRPFSIVGACSLSRSWGSTWHVTPYVYVCTGSSQEVKTGK